MSNNWNNLVNFLKDIISSNTNEEQYKNIMNLLENRKDKLTQFLSTSKIKRTKDPNAPKKWKTSYIFFCSEQRELLRNQNEKYKPTEITSKLADMWRKLSPSERVKYQELSNADKERYVEEKSNYSHAEECKNNEKNLIKRPTSSYMYFCMDVRPKFKKENPNLTAKELTSQLGKKWNNLSDEEKTPYIERQNKDKLRYSVEKSKLELTLPKVIPRQKVRKTAPVKKSKKQTSGFKNFCKEQTKTLKEDNPEWSTTEIKKELETMWDELNEEDKREYERENNKVIVEENDIDLDD
jgi:hypothetical protein